MYYIDKKINSFFYVQLTRIVINSYNKPNYVDALISQIYFWNKTLHVSDTSSVHHEFFTVNTEMVYDIMMDRGTVRKI